MERGDEINNILKRSDERKGSSQILSKSGLLNADQQKFEKIVKVWDRFESLLKKEDTP